MIDIGGILLTRWFWSMRVLTTVITLILVWKGIIMATEMILYTPAEFLPILVILGLLIGGIPVLVRAIAQFDDLNKEKLRSGEISKKMAFGLDYLSANIGIIIVAVVGAVIVPGYICDAFALEPTESLIITIGFVWSLIVGVCGCKTFTKVVDIFRDTNKIKKLEAEAEKPEAKN